MKGELKGRRVERLVARGYLKTTTTKKTCRSFLSFFFSELPGEFCTFQPQSHAVKAGAARRAAGFGAQTLFRIREDFTILETV